MSDTEVAITELLEKISKSCPHFQPAVFPFKFNPHKLDDLVSSKVSSSEEFNAWVSSVAKDLTEVSFSTKVNYSQRNVEIVELKVRF